MQRYEEHRKMVRRIVVRTTVVTASPLCVGAGLYNVTDRAVVRECREGRPMIPGTTWAGVLRSALTDIDESMAGQLFGGIAKTDIQSLLITSDSIAVGDSPAGIATLRDRVKIDPDQGVAASHAKFDMEVIAEGVAFPLELELVLVGIPEDDERRLLGFMACLRLIEDEAISLGADTRKGFGRVRRLTPWKIWDFAVGTREGLGDWIEFMSFGGGGQGVLLNSARDIATHLKVADSLESTAKNQAEFQLEFVVKGSLLVRAPADVADHSQMQWYLPTGEPGGALLPGSSIAGVVRHQAHRIVQTIGEASADHLIEEIFGRAPRSGPAKFDGKAGKFFVRETKIDGGKIMRHTRVKIDRWTGGAMENLLFTSDAWYGGCGKVQFALRGLDESAFEPALGLLLLVVKDFLTDGLDVGGETGTGRGHLNIRKAKLELVTASGARQSIVMQKPEGFDQRVDIAGDTGVLEGYIQRLWDHLAKEGVPS